MLFAFANAFSGPFFGLKHALRNINRQLKNNIDKNGMLLVFKRSDYFDKLNKKYTPGSKSIKIFQII